MGVIVAGETPARVFTVPACDALRAGRARDALQLFGEMLERGVPPDRHAYALALKACSRLRSRRRGEAVHGHYLKLRTKLGLSPDDEFVANSLISMYASCGLVDVARMLFDGMAEKAVAAWNAMLAGYFKSGMWAEAVALFRLMLADGVAFDDVTVISVLTACGRMGDLELGRWVGNYAERNELMDNRNLVTALVDMYAKCGEVDSARRIFDELPTKDVVAWSAMISGYTQADRCREALELFGAMQLAGVEPNGVTVVSVLSACAVLGAYETGRWVHEFIQRKRLGLNVAVGTALVDFYAKCGCIEEARAVFNDMPERNAWTWTAMIKGMANNGRGRQALDVFSSMQRAGVKPTGVTFIGVLLACSHAGLVGEGWQHFSSMSANHGIEPTVEHYGCMVDLLARAGHIKEARQFIKGMPIAPNAIMWRTLLSSCKVFKDVDVGEESLRQIKQLETPLSGDYILLSSIYAAAGQWAAAACVRNQMSDNRVEKAPGCSMIEIGGTMYEFFADDVGNY